jgi:hypothetical protein
VFRGRGAIDPENPKKKMCLNLPAVELAMKCHEDIPTTCCKSKKMKCRFFDKCGYQRQMPDERVDVWIVAGDVLFHMQDAFGEPAAVIIDEAIWKKGIRGIEQEQEWVVAIDSLIGPEPKLYDDIGLRNADRNGLGEALQKQVNGGVERQHLAEIFFSSELPVDGVVNTDSITHIIRREWKC